MGLDIDIPYLQDVLLQSKFIMKYVYVIYSQ
jgi:hypothetical protein